MQRVDQEISTAVRKQTAQLRNQVLAHRGSSNPPFLNNNEDISGSSSPRTRPQEKDSVDLDLLLQSKANKVDVSRGLRNAEILHSQLAHLMVLFREFLSLLGLGPTH